MIKLLGFEMMQVKVNWNVIQNLIPALQLVQSIYAAWWKTHQQEASVSVTENLNCNLIVLQLMTSTRKDISMGAFMTCLRRWLHREVPLNFLFRLTEDSSLSMNAECDNKQKVFLCIESCENDDETMSLSKVPFADFCRASCLLCGIVQPKKVLRDSSQYNVLWK